MGTYPIENLKAIERTPCSPLALSDDLWSVLGHSVSARVRVEACDRATGEYRVVVQGTLDRGGAPRADGA